MQVRIVTDSTSDLPDQIVRELNITVVPLTVFFGQEALLDHIEITPEQFYQRLRTSHEVPRTSQPSAGRFQQVFSDLAAQQRATEILCITLSSKLSGTLNSARTAAMQPPSGCRIVTLDSQSISGGLGAIVRAAAEVSVAGGTCEEAMAAAARMIPAQHISIMLDTLEYLQRGGRIGRARALLGGLLNIKPIITVQGGEVGPGERVRSRQRGIDRIFERTAATPNLDRVVVEHTGCEDDAAVLAERLKTALPGIPVDIGWIGPVVGVYVGPNGLGAVTVERVGDTG